MKPLISVVTACFNEEDNVEELYTRVRAEFAKLPTYRYEHIFIDNASSDQTVAKLKALALTDKAVKVIVNTRNFGHIRSPFHGLMQARGDAVISMVADLQDPPELIAALLAKWQQGFKIVVGIKPTAAENVLMAAFRRQCYRVFAKLTPIKQIKNFTGFGLYDQHVMTILRDFADPYPYFRGMIAEIGFEVCEIPYHQPARRRGFTKNNFYTLYDMAMLGLTSYSKTPLRLATGLGFVVGGLSVLAAIILLVIKLCCWHSVDLGMAPLAVAITFFAAVQLFFIGLLGEYLSAIQTQVQNRPWVIEKERVNFE